MHNSDELKGLWFSFEIDGDEYVAFISMEALHVHFRAAGTDKHHLVAAYQKNRAQVDTMAKERFRNHAPRPVRLTVNDFRSDDLP